MKSTEARVSDRFRDRTPFPSHVVELAKRSIDLFSAARTDADAYRFNKASVLSFLLFYVRFSIERPDPFFVQTFIDAGKRQFTGHFLTEAAALFEDRASLRVTDVSSVIYRDFSLWYIYFFTGNRTMPEFIPSRVLIEVENTLAQRDDVTFGHSLGQVLRADLWAATL